nr:hypothetical protein [uncultured Rhodopila sp.]
MAQAAFEIPAASARGMKPAAPADNPSPAMRGIVFAILLSLPVWAVAGYLVFRLL